MPHPIALVDSAISPADGIVVTDSCIDSGASLAARLRATFLPRAVILGHGAIFRRAS